MSKDKQTLGFIGTGLMGLPMATRLLDAGYEVHVWNRSSAKLAPLIAKGAIAVASPADVAAAADIVFLCLTDGRAVEHVVLGDKGISDAKGKTSLVVDFSTITPMVTRSLASRLKEKCGLDWVDAPVSGGVPGAQKGTLAIMCGGLTSQIDSLRPILAHLASRVTHMGDVGAGQIAKLCNQLIVSTNILAIAEAISLGRQCGIDVEKLPVALEGGFADSIPLQLFGPRMATSSYEPKISEINTMLKDMESILATADDVGFKTRLGSSARDVYRAAAAAGLGQEDLARLGEFCSGGAVEGE